MRKHVIAVVAGIASFLPLMFLGETIGDQAALLFVTVYYFVCQFFLSRGHERAYADWSLMLALDASTLLLVFFLADGRLRSSFNQRLLAWTLVGTFAGAAAAALAARSGRSGLWGRGPVPRPPVAGAGALVFGLAGSVIGALATHQTGSLAANVCCALGAAVGAYLADRRRGRLELVLAGALAVAFIAWRIPLLPGVIRGFWAGPPLMTATVLAATFAAAGIETSTARHRKVGA